MIAGDVILWMMAGVLSILALVVSYYVLLEVVVIARELVATLGERQVNQSVEMPRSPDDTGPLPAIRPYRDRATVKRLIDHLREEDTDEEQ